MGWLGALIPAWLRSLRADARSSDPGHLIRLIPDSLSG
jgi:hypothetical protein